VWTLSWWLTLNWSKSFARLHSLALLVNAYIFSNNNSSISLHSTHAWHSRTVPGLNTSSCDQSVGFNNYAFHLAGRRLQVILSLPRLQGPTTLTTSHHHASLCSPKSTSTLLMIYVSVYVTHVSGDIFMYAFHLKFKFKFVYSNVSFRARRYGGSLSLFAGGKITPLGKKKGWIPHPLSTQLWQNQNHTNIGQ